MWHNFDSFGYGMHMPFTFGLFAPFFLIILALGLALKGYTLWHAAKRNEMWWFIALLIINTFGILELIYIVFFLKKFKVTPESETLKPEKHEHIAEK